jgi:ferredoxin
VTTDFGLAPSANRIVASASARFERHFSQVRDAGGHAIDRPMPSLVVLPPSGAEISVDMPAGGALADACDKHDLPIPFSCRSASCGTCRIDILDGMNLLSDPEDEELDILDMFSAPKNQRLACCAKAKPGPGVIKVRPVNDY